MAAPLKPIELYVLLGLSEQPLHGYALTERIAELSDGGMQPLPGNLYVVLHRLGARGLLCPAEGAAAAAAESEDGRRRLYQLTARGRDTLRDELARFDRLLRSSPARRALAPRGGRPR